MTVYITLATSFRKCERVEQTNNPAFCEDKRQPPSDIGVQFPNTVRVIPLLLAFKISERYRAEIFIMIC